MQKIITNTKKPKKAEDEGGEKDIVAVWEQIYKQRGWGKFARFDKAGGLNHPYVLFKAKNVTDPADRDKKLYKVRPYMIDTYPPYLELAWIQTVSTVSRT